MNLIVFAFTGVVVVWFTLEYILLTKHRDSLLLVDLFVSACVWVLGAVFAATLLAVCGLYSLYMCCGMLFTVAAVFHAYICRRSGTPFFSLTVIRACKNSAHFPDKITCAFLLVVGIAGVLYVLFPTNYLFGGRDYGLYEINAVHVATTGGYQYESDAFYAERYEAIKDIASLSYPALFSAHKQGISDDVGKIDPQFLPMTSSGMALGYDVLGFSGLLRFNAVIYLLAMVTLFFLAGELFGRRAALLATLFLAVCPAQIWNARISGSEGLALLLFLLTAYCLVIGLKQDSCGLVLVAGVLLGIGCFNRIDNYVLLIGLCGVTCYYLLWGRTNTNALLASTAVAAGICLLSVVYGILFHHFYFVDHIQRATGVLKWLLLGCGLAVAVTVFMAFFSRTRMSNKIKNPLALLERKNGSLALGTLFFLLFLFAYFVRPNFSTILPGRSMAEYSWYISALAVPLAIIGLCCFLRKGENRQTTERSLYFLLCGMGSVVMYTIDPSVAADHFWASRRWVPVNYAFLLTMAAVVVGYLWRIDNLAGYKRLAGIAAKAVSVFCGAVMVGYMLWQCRLFIFTSMFTGINGQYEMLAENLPDDTIVVTAEGNIASVLKYVYGKPVYLLNSTQEQIDKTYADGYKPLSDTPLSIKAAQQYVNEYGEMYIIGPDSQFWQVGTIEMIYDSVLAGNYPEMSIGSYPQTLERWEFDVAVYRLTPSDGPKSYNFLRGQILGNASTRDENWNISLDRPETVFYGPYTSLYAGSYRLEMDLAGDEAFEAVLNIQLEAGTNIVASERYDAPGTYVVEFSFDQNIEGLEFALVNNSYALVTCTRLELFEVEVYE